MAVLTRPSFADVPKLLAAAREGSRVAFGDLLTLYRGRLLRISRDRLPASVASRCADDLVGWTMEQAWKRLAKCRAASAARFSAWLTRIHLRRADRLAGKFAPRRDRSLDELLDGQDDAELRGVLFPLWRVLSSHEPEPYEAAVRAEQLRVLAEVLRELSPEEQSLVQLRFEFDLEWSQVALALGCDVEAARSAWRRLCQRLAPLLRSRGIDG